MATPGSVYNTTTIQEPKTKKWFNVPSEHLDTRRCILKVVEVVLSLLAFIMEEVVTVCTDCSGLYFFEFVSCTAFLFTGLLLIILTTNLHKRIGITCWGMMDLIYTVLMAVLFLIASVVFINTNNGTPLETTAVVFGFLSTFFFCVDAVLLFKQKGIPFKSRAQPPPDHQIAPVPETERLNDNGVD